MNDTLNYEKAFVEGADFGMGVGVCWNGLIETKPTDADLEVAAEKIFKLRGLTFASSFDGRMSFIAGFWQGWKKGIAPVPIRRFVENPLQS